MTILSKNILLVIENLMNIKFFKNYVILIEIKFIKKFSQKINNKRWNELKSLEIKSTTLSESIFEISQTTMFFKRKLI